MKKISSLIAIVLFILLRLPAEKIRFSADSLSGQAGNSSTTTRMEGNASVQTDSIQIKANILQLSGEDYRDITAEGSVVGKNLETNMEFSCDSLSYDRKTKQIVLKGNVSLIDVENKVNCGAQIIEYDQDKEIAIMQIQISLTQKDNVCSGSYAVYYKERQLLEISGNAQVKQKEDTFRAQFITLDLDTQDITLGGNVKGTVTDTKEEKSEDSEQGLNDAKADEKAASAEQAASGGKAASDGKAASGEEEASGKKSVSDKKTASVEENATEKTDGKEEND